MPALLIYDPMNPYNTHEAVAASDTEHARSHAAEGHSKDGGGSMALSHVPTSSGAAWAVSPMLLTLPVISHSCSTLCPVQFFRGSSDTPMLFVWKHVYVLEHRLHFCTTLGHLHTAGIKR